MRSKAAAEYPGTTIPDMRRDPEAYATYWRKMAMWAYKWGLYLSQKGYDESSGSDRRGNGRT